MKEFTYKIAKNDMELAGVRDVRRQVFVEEQGIAEALVFAGESSDEEITVVVLDEKTAIGTARIIFPVKDTAKIERMAVLKRFRNQGVGRDMIAFIKATAESRQVKHLVLHAQHTAVNFYQSCGFRELGAYFIEAGIKHIQMELEF